MWSIARLRSCREGAPPLGTFRLLWHRSCYDTLMSDEDDEVDRHGYSKNLGSLILTGREFCGWLERLEAMKPSVWDAVNQIVRRASVQGWSDGDFRDLIDALSKVTLEYVPPDAEQEIRDERKWN